MGFASVQPALLVIHGDSVLGVIISHQYWRAMEPTIGKGKQVMQRAIICDLDGTLSLYDRSTGQHYERDYENEHPQIEL